MTRLQLIWIIIRVLWFLLWATLRAVLMSVITLWKTVPGEIDDIATQWVVRALNLGFPHSGENIMYYCYYFLGWVIFAIGWTISAHLTILLEHLIFR